MIYEGDCLVELKKLESESVDCVITSPPYWGLRDYGIEGQLGLESRFQDYIENLCLIFDEVKRVLKPEGTCWVNIGDNYSTGTGEPNSGFAERAAIDFRGGGKRPANTATWNRKPVKGLPSKSLVQIPSRFAIAMTDRGWILRNEIIWHKPNCMPASVKDRFTVDFEKVFFFVKSKRYYFEQQVEAASTAAEVTPWQERIYDQSMLAQKQAHGIKGRPQGVAGYVAPYMRNKRTVWSIPTTPYNEAHFATFPEALIRPMIKAGCPLQVCDLCGYDGQKKTVRTPLGYGAIDDPTIKTGRAGFNRPRRDNEATRPISIAEQQYYANKIRRSPYYEIMKKEAGTAIQHYTRTDKSGARPVPPVMLTRWIESGYITIYQPQINCEHIYRPGVVLDPFFGAGTTGVVAKKLGRKYIGIELNPEYIRLAEKRLRQEVLL